MKHTEWARCLIQDNDIFYEVKQHVEHYFQIYVRICLQGTIICEQNKTQTWNIVEENKTCNPKTSVFVKI